MNNLVHPTQFRMQGEQTNIPVRPSAGVSTKTAPEFSMASFGAFGSASAAPLSVPSSAAAAAAADANEALGTYAYGREGFPWQ